MSIFRIVIMASNARLAWDENASLCLNAGPPLRPRQVWRTLWRDDALRQQLVNGTHSPGQIRAYTPLRNIDAWHEAFNVTAADPLWVAPEDRVRIW